MPAFNWLDFLIIGVMGISGLVGLFRGLLREVLSLMTWAVAIWAGLRFSGDLARHFETLLPSPTARTAVAFGVLFILALVLAGMVGYVLSRILESTGLSGIDRMAGLLFGVGRGALILSVAVFLARVTPFPKEAAWQSSRLIPIFQTLAVWLEAQVPPGFVPRFADKTSSH